MSTYTVNIISALLAFPFCAGVFTMPYAIVQYRKYGSIPFLRIVIVYSFILYLLCAYFMVILPLPEIDEVAKITESMVQPVPFMFVRDFFAKSGFVLTSPSTYMSALSSSQIYVPLFNILLCMPFGVYLRYYYERKWHQVLLLSFCLSLFFELTQLSGLYGIYPHAYRLFDVDDLMLNTLGGMCGFWLSFLLMKILPSRDAIDDLAYRNGERVTLTRRSVACAIDWFSVGVVMILLTRINAFARLADISFVPLYAMGAFIIFFAVPLISKGVTLGKFCVNIRLVNDRGERPEFYRYILRYGFLYGIIVPSPVWLIFFFDMLSRSEGVLWAVSFTGIILSIYTSIRFAVDYFVTGLKKESAFVYEKISGTSNMSTVVKQKSLEE